MPPFEKHLFICTHKREASDARSCCAAKGSENILDFFKEELKKRGLSGRLRANASGCLDHCSQGPVLVIYPEGTWYHVSSLADAQEIIEKDLVQNQKVERLLLYPVKNNLNE